jgi:paired amphipathic helix protein Sin3a
VYQDGLANKVQISLHKKDDPIADDGLSVLDRENKWRYYIASYTSVDNTDNIDINQVRYPFLMSNIRHFGADPRSETFPPQALDESSRSSLEAKARFLEVKNEERLQLRIAVNNYKAFFQKDTYESWYVPTAEEREGGERGVERAELARGERDEVVLDRFVRFNGAMEGLAREGVEGVNEKWKALVEKGTEGAEDGEGMDVD